MTLYRVRLQNIAWDTGPSPRADAKRLPSALAYTLHADRVDDATEIAFATAAAEYGYPIAQARTRVTLLDPIVKSRA